ncbi:MULTISPECIES: hypothetical protein [unclassified Pseudoalteromonas]|uniref:hypothetical protein n=1 Tax=unclassified Pseudoalteromonas TaxID=194690 RepID=UPI000A979523|nr:MULTISPECIES: hypothetical protein [unclassified Pseudoalteromonas]
MKDNMDHELKVINSSNGSKKSNRMKRRKQNVIPLFDASDNNIENIDDFIKNAKKIHNSMFDYGVKWDDYCWDIRGFESTTGLKDVTHDANILFTQSNGLKPKQKIARVHEAPFAEPFASFAKAFITHNHKVKPKNHASHMVSMRAIRYIYEVLPNKEFPCISDILPEHFDLALNRAMKREKNSTLYVTGGKLEEIASVLDKHRLTRSLIEWKNSIPRNYKHGGSAHNRGGKKAKKERAKQLPKTEILLFLSAMWANYDEIEERDKALVCMAVILMVCGFRMDEFVGLDMNCIPSREEYEAQDYELDPERGTYTRVLRIRALARKKYHWDEKIVPSCTVDTIFEAVDRLKVISEPHRLMAQTFLEEGKWLKFASYDDDEYLSAKEVQSVLGFSGHSTSNIISTLKRYGVEKDPDSPPRHTRFRVGDIHEGFRDYYVDRIGPIRNGFGHGELIIPIWELLTLRFQDQYTPKEKLNVFAQPLTGTQIQDFFRGRDYISRVSRDEKRVLSVFERYEFLELGDVDGSVRTHQFRHLLNTLMQESDMFSQEDIAKNFLRKNSQDNKAYNHKIEPTKYADRTKHFQDNVLSKLNLDAEKAKDVIQRFPLLSHEELQKDLDDAGSYHFTDIGRCRHDYTQGQCGMHYMCLRNCINYKRKKGDPAEIEKITLRRDMTIKQMRLAKEDADDDFEGANNWYLNHKELVSGCDAALAIETDERFSIGEIIQIFPEGIDQCEEANDE